MRLLALSLALPIFLLTAPAASAQATTPEATQAPAAESVRPASQEKIDINAHIFDSHELEYPCANAARGYACEYELPRWAPVRVGPLTLDLSPTKHVVWLLIASVISGALLIGAALSHRKHAEETGVPKGFAGGIEAMVLYIRNEVILPNVGPHGDAFVPFGLSLFFFILFANLMGLIPFGSTATGNVSVTATLAIVTFLVVEVAGMRALGPAYIGTVVYWPSDMSLLMKIPMTLIMTPVEIVGKITKPFALTVRLLANMTAGHVVLLALISLIFVFKSLFIAVVPVGMAVAISALELFVAFLQAFIFTLLASVFIGQIRETHH